MPDIFSKRKRSAVMSAIRSRGNRDTELRLITLMRAHGITGWRRGSVIRDQKSEVGCQKAEPGRRKIGGKRRVRFAVRPDFVFRSKRLAVFVDGCFWHGCPRHFIKPKGNTAFWRKKIAANRARDRLVTRTLRAQGWHVLRVWEHELLRRDERRLLSRLNRALGF